MAHMSVDFRIFIGPALFYESVLDSLARELATRPSWCVEAVDDDTMLSALVQPFGEQASDSSSS